METDLESASLPIHAPPRPRRARMGLFVVLLVTANFVWAGQLSAVKYMDAHLGPFAIAFLPFFFVTPLMIPLLAWSRRKNPPAPAPTAGDWTAFTVAGLAQLVCQLGMNWGPLKADPSSCGILYLLVPVFTAVFASVLLAERITLLRVGCLAIGLGGALYISMQDFHAESYLKSEYFLGNMLMIAGCAGAAFYNVYCKGLMRKFNERDILIYSYITATPASLPVLLWMEPDAFSRLAHMTGWVPWTAFAFNVLLVYGISMLMLFYVLQFLPVTIVLASTYLIPVFGVFLGRMLFHDRLTVNKIVGGLVVLLATVLIMKYDAAAAEPAATDGA
ncbi:MAG: DMT family transporter [Phycisphaerae bacterium]